MSGRDQDGKITWFNLFVFIIQLATASVVQNQTLTCCTTIALLCGYYTVPLPVEYVHVPHGTEPDLCTHSNTVYISNHLMCWKCLICVHKWTLICSVNPSAYVQEYTCTPHTDTHIVCACKRSRHHDCHISQPANLPDLWHWCIKIIVILKVSTSYLCVLQMSIYTLVWSRDVAMNTMYQIGLLYVCDIICSQSYQAYDTRAIQSDRSLQHHIIAI